MTVEVIGIDHVYVAVRDLRVSETFYDNVMAVLGFRKRHAEIGGDPHVLYHNRHFGYVLRPAKERTPEHDPYAPGLHHFCFRVADEAAVDSAAEQLSKRESRRPSRATTLSTIPTTTQPSSKTLTA